MAVHKNEVSALVSEKKRISFVIKDLSCGCATTEILLQHKTFTCDFEYTPNDALYDLVHSAICITNNLGSLVCFPGHPSDTVLMVVEPQDKLTCKIIISENIEYSDVNKYRNNIQNIPRLHEASVPVKQYVKAVLRMFDKYIYEYSEKEYEAHWYYSYPKQELNALRNRYRSQIKQDDA